MEDPRKIEIYGHEKIEALLTNFKCSEQTLLVMCHPHPLFGGNMHDLRLEFLTKRIVKFLDFAVLRFNFRGVSKSSGSYGNLKGEVVDLEDVLMFASKELRAQNFILLGYSFGSAVVGSFLAEGRNKKVLSKVRKAVLIAPPISLFPFDFSTINEFDHIAIVGEEDEFFDFTGNMFSNYHVLDGADHFFTGKLNELWEEVNEFLTKEDR